MPSVLLLKLQVYEGKEPLTLYKIVKKYYVVVFISYEHRIFLSLSDVNIDRIFGWLVGVV